MNCTKTYIPFLVLMFFVAMASNSAKCEPIEAAGFSFSDELGGYRLLDVSGDGSRETPFFIQEELQETGAAILVIRRLFEAGTGRGWHPNARRTRIHFRKSVTNRTGKVWSAFQLELRQNLEWPSSLEDGLSFDQIWQRSDDVSATRFNRKQRLFEPSDRVKFDQGHVNPDELFELAVPVTDPTPVAEFYLIQLPEFLIACDKENCGE